MSISTRADTSYPRPLQRKAVYLTLAALATLVAGCAQQATPTPIATPRATATPTPTPIGGIPESVPKVYAPPTTAGELAHLYETDRAAVDEVYRGKVATVTGLAFKETGARDAIVLQGTSTASVLCFSAAGAVQGVRLPLPFDGEYVLVQGTLGAAGGLEEENVVLRDCVVRQAGEKVTGVTAKFPAVGTLGGFGLFWFWAGFAALGYLPVRRWRTTSGWLFAPQLFFHTTAVVVLYAFFGRLVLRSFDELGPFWDMVLWPWILFLNSGGA